MCEMYQYLIALFSYQESFIDFIAYLLYRGSFFNPKIYHFYKVLFVCICTCVSGCSMNPIHKNENFEMFHILSSLIFEISYSVFSLDCFIFEGDVFLCSQLLLEIS